MLAAVAGWLGIRVLCTEGMLASGPPGDVLPAAGQLDRAGRRRRARGGAVGDGDARGAGGGRRHRQAGPLPRRV